MLKKIRIADTTLHVQDEGSGPAILFVHGFPLDHSMWRHQVAEFARDYRCIAPDLRGFGKSDSAQGTVTMERFADDLAELLNTLEISDRIVLCGLSMGGYIAWQFVKRQAHRLASLILCDTRAVADTAEGAANRLKMAAEVMNSGPQIVADTMLPKLLLPARGLPADHIADELRQVILATSPSSIAAAARGMAQRIDARPLLPAISVPTLVIVGDHDLISPPAEMSEIAASIPGATFVTIPNSGHMAPMENHVAVNAAITQFLRG